MIYELEVELEILLDKEDNIEGITILDERPEIGIQSLISDKMWDIEEAIQRDVDERILQDNLDKQENRFDRMDAET